MSRLHEFDEDAELIDDPELEAEIDLAIADADAHPGEGIDADELIRQLREERVRQYPSSR